MGKLILAIIGKEELFGADMSNNKALEYYEQTKLLEEKFVKRKSSLVQTTYDEYHFEPETFISFFNSAWSIDNLCKEGEPFHSWARYTAGIIENITNKPLNKKDINGNALIPIKYQKY